MASWSINGGGIGSSNTQLGFGTFNKNPFAITTDNKPNSTSGFGSNSSVNSFNAGNPFATQPPRPIGGSTTNTWFQAPPPPAPFHTSSNSTAGAPFSFGVSTSLPGQTTSNSPTSTISTSPFWTKNQTGGAPFSSSSSVNSTSLFNQTNSVPAAFPTMTSPFGITTPSTTSSSTGFSFAPSMISPFPQSPMTSFGTTSAFNNTKGSFVSVQQNNTSPSNVSVFAPFTSTDPWNSGIHQGTRQKAYAKTREEGSAKNELINSLSAMPSYKNKSHEELRLEDYKLIGKTGTDSSFNIPIINTSTPTFPKFSIVNPPSTPTFPKFSIVYPPSTPTFPKFSIVNPSPFTSPSFRPSTPSTSIFDKPTPFPPLSQPVTMPLFPTTHTTTTFPNSGTGFPNITVPTTDSIITSIPETVPQGCVIPALVPLRENNQQQQLVLPASPCPVSVGPSLVTNPFATEVRDTLPLRTVQYGISCLPVYENPQPAKKMPLVNVRGLSVGRRRPSIEKYKPKEDEKKVPFFEELPGMYKKGAVLIPRENPRSWVVLPNEEQRLEKNLSKLSVSDNSTNLCKTEGTQSENSSQVRERVPQMNLSKEIKHGDDHKEPDILLAMIPQIKRPEYYMEPSMEDLAKNELRKPGFCSHVKDFVIGRLKRGSIKFLGETDIRSLELESIVQFGNRKVIVYEDEKRKPPVGQGLNKAAEITLLNIKCIDKNTGKQCIDGPKVDQYKKFLVRKAMEQGAEFVSFDPVKGEWRFKVEHF